MKVKVFITIFSTVTLFISCNDVSETKRNSSETKTININSISKNKTIKIIEDDFEGPLKKIWKKEQQDSSRILTVSDPLNKNNKVLKVDLNIGDYASGGLRTEVLFEPKDSFGYQTNYSFKFLFPDDFFKKGEKKGWFIIHQWHDAPAPGFNWKTYNRITAPPIHLLVEHNPNGDYYLIFKTGLKIGSMDEIYSVFWKEKLKPNEWYEFSCEVLWSLYNSEGYAAPKLNGEPPYDFSDEVTQKRVKVMRRNMYNSIPNYFKMGLYRSNYEEYNRTIYFDDLKYNSFRVK
ncbi:MAG: heparin lyase I family protein [Patiriisocius sp.]|uniref:heparin lyase I family protein n=1 Tax=Patiriisocius sp. TaxID=2822396 RepID=UPI003EF4A83D